MPPPKSIFRQPGARHFQLVHRSQRDPLIHDSDASQHVLREFERDNSKGKSRADLESSIPASQLAHDLDRENLGEAAGYGVYFDDTDYDYMQHLKPVGLREDGVDSVLLEALVPKTKGKGAKSKEPIKLVELPPEALPSTSELPLNYEAQAAVPSSISGFRPDMDPHLRQALEALEDDEFVDDNLEDDFFEDLVGGGARAEEEDSGFDFHEWGPDGGAKDEEDLDEEKGDWQSAFAKFKKSQKADSATGGSEIDFNSEGGDTIGSMPQFSVIGGKKRRKGSSDGSGYSMSSSSMFRNEGLTTLDEQFDQIEKEYASDEDEEDESQTHSDTDEAPELLTSRDDFAAMMNEFMDEYEILGGKMKPVLAGDSGLEKLNTMRRALGEVTIRDQESDEEDDRDILMPLGENDAKDRWDCETILTTYSNLENHPRLIRARDPRPIPKIRLDPKTGLPTVDDDRALEPVEDSDSDDDRPFRPTVTRPRDEPKEDKKIRKQAVKAERQARRVEKKSTKEQFSAEIHHQTKSLANKEKTRMKKL